jgi:hypothetical protein
MIRDNEILKAIQYKLEVYDSNKPLLEQDLQKINDIYLSNVNYDGDTKNIDLTQISVLTNLRILDLKGFVINQQFADTINNLVNLKYLILRECDIKKTVDVKNADRIILERCKIGNLELLTLPKRFEVIDGGDIDLSQANASKFNVEEIVLYNCNVKKIVSLTEFSNLKQIELVGTKVDSPDTVKALSISPSLFVKYEPNNKYSGSRFTI